MAFGRRLIQSLGERELVIPYLEQSILKQNWPDYYTITVDSRPYYGTGDGCFHPSSDCLLEARQLYFKKKPPKNAAHRPRNLGLEMAASLGTAYHAILQTQLIQAGLVKPENVEREVRSEEHRGRGHIDGIVDHPNGNTYLLDIKSKSSYGFRSMQGPQKSWIYQMNCYLDWLDLEECVIVMVLTEYPYSFREFRIKRNRELLRPVYEKWDYVSECLDKEVPPREYCTNSSPVSKKCQSCPFSRECWGEV